MAGSYGIRRFLLLPSDRKSGHFALIRIQFAKGASDLSQARPCAICQNELVPVRAHVKTGSGQG